jgi:hypothetical protein
MKLPVVAMSGPFVRVHRIGLPGDPPGFRHSGDNRFDSPDGSYDVTYLTLDVSTALMESVFSDPGAIEIDAHYLETRAVSLIQSRPGKALQLVDLTGAGLAVVGADNRLTTGDHPLAQRWSAAFETHPCAPDGLVYRSRRQPSVPSLVIFGRAADNLVVVATDPLLPKYQSIVDELLDKMHVALL